MHCLTDLDHKHYFIKSVVIPSSKYAISFALGHALGGVSETYIPYTLLWRTCTVSIKLCYYML